MGMTPVLRRAQAGSNPLSLYRQMMDGLAGSTGQTVDVFA